MAETFQEQASVNQEPKSPNQLEDVSIEMPVTPKEVSEIIKKESSIEQQLKSGLLPEALRESWKIIDLNSPQAKQFQASLQELAEILYAPTKGGEHLPNYEFKQHDFEKEPIRFLLSKEKYPNAWFVGHSNPPMIVLTEGLFVAEGENEEPAIQSQNDLAAVLCHEMTHLKMRQVYGAIPNSKIEEGFAYSFPLLLMYEKGRQIGLNPEKVIDESGRKGVYSVLHSQSKKNQSWSGYFDVHPSPDNISSIANNTLAYLKKEKGKLAPDVPEVKPYTENDELIKTINEAEFTSFIEKALQEYPDYKNLPIVQKISVLGSILESMGKDKWDIRVYDFVAEVRKLKSEVKLDDKDAKKAINNLANAVLKIGDEGNMRTMEKIYSSLVAITAKGLEVPPLGRLRKVSKNARLFIKAVRENEDDEAIISSAGVFVESLEGSDESGGEPFMNTVDGQVFLRTITWPQFNLPSREKIRRSRRLGEDGVEVEWSSVKNLSAQNIDVAKAGVYLGLTRDPQILEGALKHEDIVLRMIATTKGGLLKNIYGAIPEISSGPRNEDIGLKDLKFNEDGLVIGLTSKDEEEFRINTLENYLDNWVEQTFLDAESDPNAQEVLSKLAVDRGENMIGLNSLDKNFALFLKVNEFLLTTNEIAMGRFMKKLANLGEAGDALQRELFNSEHGKLIVENSLLSRAFIEYEPAIEDGEMIKEVISNPYLNLLLRDKKNIYRSGKT